MAWLLLVRLFDKTLESLLERYGEETQQKCLRKLRNKEPHVAENEKPLNAVEFDKGLRKRYAQKDEEYESMLGIFRETPRTLNALTT